MLQAILGFVVAALAGIIFAWLEETMVEDYPYGSLEPGFFAALGTVVEVVFRYKTNCLTEIVRSIFQS